MIVFTLITSDIDNSYLNCINQIATVYPELKTVNMDVKVNGWKYDSDYYRILNIANQWKCDDVLYLDADTICCKRIERRFKPAVYCGSANSINPCVLFKPKGYESFFQNILTAYNTKNRKWLFSKILQLHDDFDHLNGYPDYVYFKHLAFSINLRRQYGRLMECTAESITNKHRPDSNYAV